MICNKMHRFLYCVYRDMFYPVTQLEISHFKAKAFLLEKFHLIKNNGPKIVCKMIQLSKCFSVKCF